jgi:hypothetical protein
MFYLLAREVRMLRGDTPRGEDWEVMVDLFMYRNITENKKAIAADDEDEDDEGNAEPADVLRKDQTAGEDQGDDDEEEGEDEDEEAA